MSKGISCSFVGGSPDCKVSGMTFSVWAEAAQVCIATDVAYRVSSTGGRTFIVADAAGDEQYTRDMVIVASAAD